MEKLLKVNQNQKNIILNPVRVQYDEESKKLALKIRLIPENIEKAKILRMFGNRMS
jgi:hypothetical protein